MVRTHITTLVALLALLAANFTLAFGLGEITLKSYLNQPFDAEIELLNIGDLTENEVIPKLASPKDFENVGLERAFFLTELEFEVILDEKQAKNYISIKSNEPVTEPYLDFLVEFLWPEGRLLREYTVLLDPPSYAAQAPQNTQAPVVALNNQQSSPQNTTNIQPAPTQDQKVESVPAPATSAPATQSAAAPVSNRTITTSPKDTLWSLASRERPVETVSVQQTMLAIQELNPDAFDHDNINYLKKNQVLRMPTEDQIRSLATREAMGIVADQNREWAGRTLANGGTLPADTAKLVGNRQVTPMQDGALSGDQMKLVADSGAEGSAIGTYGGTGSGANADDALRGTRQTKQLLVEKKALMSQVETSEKLISLKDRQIAELQARLAEQGKDTQTDLDQEVNNVIERVAVAEQEMELAELDEPLDSEVDTSETDNEELEIAKAMAEAESDAETAGDSGFSDEETSDSSAQDENAQEEELSFETTENAELATSEKDKTMPEPVAEPGLFEQTWFLAVIGLLVLLLLGGLGFFLYKRRLASADNSAQVSFDETTDADGFDDLDDMEIGFGDDGELSDDSSGDELGGNAQGADILTEADTYISYNRHKQAVDLLKDAITEGNDDVAVKVKLLEAYAGVGDQEAFDTLSADVLDEDASQQSIIDQLSSSFEGSQTEDTSLDDSFDMDATTRMDASDFDLDSNEEEFDISLDDLASDLDANFDAGDSDDSSDDDDSDSIDLSDEFESEFDSADNLSESSDDLNLDDLDLSDDSNDEEVSDDVELDLDLDDTIIVGAEEANATSDDDVELNLDLDDTVVIEAEKDDEETDLGDLNFDDDDDNSENDSALDLEDDDDLELDFDLDDAEEHKKESKKDSDGELDLDLDSDDEDDLDLDFDLGDDAEQESELDLSDEDDFSDDGLDLGSDLDLEEGDDLETDDDSLFGDSNDDDFDLPDEGDEAATKLDLARAYIDMGDEDGAKDILEEVLAEGDDSQKAEAKDLLAKL
jgi:pilus assembly protein FimV